MFLLDDLFIKLPVKGLMSMLEKISDIAQAEVTDESKIKDDLLRLQTLFEMDQITEEEFQKNEAMLLERLTLAREARANT